MKNGAVVVFFTVGMLVGAANAAEYDQRNEISLLLGGYATGTKILIQGEGDAGRGGGAYGVRYLKALNDRIGLGFEFDSFNPGAAESSSLVTNAISSVKVQSNQIMAIGRARFGRERIHPYAIAGVGLHSTSMQIDVKPQAGFVWTNTGTREPRTAVDDRQLGAALSLQGGLDIDVAPAFAIGVGLGWHYASAVTYAATPSGQAGGLAGVKGALGGATVGLSAAFRF